MSRKCGECRACCTLLAVDAVDKPARQPCRHECAAGCAIQKSKPAECKSYECLWLKGEFEEADRPDRIGAVFENGIGGHGFVARESKIGAADSGRAARIVERFMARRTPGIVVGPNGAKRMKVPDGLTATLNEDVMSVSVKPDVKPDEEPFKGFEEIRRIPGSTFTDCSTIIVVPTRGIEKHVADKRCESGDHVKCFVDAVPRKVVQSWQGLIAPMNQKRAFLYADGHEVGKAYDAMVSNILQDPNLSKWKYILSLEDDNIIPPDAHIRLLESIEAGPFDAVGGIYFTKGPVNMPMAYGDPQKYRTTGELEFTPRDINAHLQRGENVIEVNGIAMGCTLWRTELLKSMPQPWFVTVSDIVPGKGAIGFTQDLYFCRLARQRGKRFGVDLRVKVGHLDKETGVVY